MVMIEVENLAIIHIVLRPGLYIKYEIKRSIINHKIKIENYQNIDRNEPLIHNDIKLKAKDRDS